MRRPLASFALLGLGLVACSSDPATFRPAKGATDAPATKTAYRVKQVPPECTSIGYVNADGPTALEDIAQTAAHHGANTYLISNDDADERVGKVSGDEIVSRTNHRYVAEVYRCPTSEDLPK